MALVPDASVRQVSLPFHPESGGVAAGRLDREGTRA